MIDNVLMIVFSLLNMCGILLWAAVFMLSMDVVFCRDAQNLRIRRIFSRNFCVRMAKLRRRFNLDYKYRGSVLVLIGSGIAIFLKLSELSVIADYSITWARILTSLLIPLGIITHYKFMGYRISLFS